MSVKLIPRYLTDQTIVTAEKDKFGHHTIAEQIGLIIDSTPLESSLNIGIFGRWGIGKSSVVGILQSEVLKPKIEANELKFITVNVWKYKTEASLRNKIYYQLAKGLDFSDDKLNEIYTTTTSSYNKEIRAFTKFLKLKVKEWTYEDYAKSIILLLIISLITYMFFGRRDSYYSTLLVSLFSFITLKGAFDLIKILVASNTVHSKRFEHEEQFEHGITDELNKSNYKDIIKVIFIDDLDRCDTGKVISTLETIKTFLNIEKCIFLIACDPEIIKKAVIQNNVPFGYTEKDGNYYLEKFFQHFIYIPPIIPTNMREYTKSLVIDNNLLKDYGLSEEKIDNVIYILAYKDVVNPRKIKVLINSFIFDLNVAIEREKNPIIPLKAGALTSNPELIAVMTILKHDFSFVIDDLISYPNILLPLSKRDVSTLNNDFSDLKVKYWELTGDNAGKNIYPDYHDVNLLIEFLEIARPWIEYNISPFIYMNFDSNSVLAEDKDYIKIDRIVRNNSLKDVLEYYNGITDPILSSKFVEFCGTRIENLKLWIEIENACKIFSHLFQNENLPSIFINDHIKHVINSFRIKFMRANSIEGYSVNGLVCISQKIKEFNSTSESQTFFEKIMTLIDAQPDEDIKREFYKYSLDEDILSIQSEEVTANLIDNVKIKNIEELEIDRHKKILLSISGSSEHLIHLLKETLEPAIGEYTDEFYQDKEGEAPDPKWERLKKYLREIIDHFVEAGKKEISNSLLEIWYRETPWVYSAKYYQDCLDKFDLFEGDELETYADLLYTCPDSDIVIGLAGSLKIFELRFSGIDIIDDENILNMNEFLFKMFNHDLFKKESETDSPELTNTIFKFLTFYYDFLSSQSRHYDEKLIDVLTSSIKLDYYHESFFDRLLQFHAVVIKNTNDRYLNAVSEKLLNYFWYESDLAGPYLKYQKSLDFFASVLSHLKRSNRTIDDDIVFLNTNIEKANYLTEVIDSEEKRKVIEKTFYLISDVSNFTELNKEAFIYFINSGVDVNVRNIAISFLHRNTSVLKRDVKRIETSLIERISNTTVNEIFQKSLELLLLFTSYDKLEDIADNEFLKASGSLFKNRKTINLLNKSFLTAIDRSRSNFQLSFTLLTSHLNFLSLNRLSVNENYLHSVKLFRKVLDSPKGTDRYTNLKFLLQHLLNVKTSLSGAAKVEMQNLLIEAEGAYERLHSLIKQARYHFGIKEKLFSKLISPFKFKNKKS